MALTASLPASRGVSSTSTVRLAPAARSPSGCDDTAASPPPGGIRSIFTFSAGPVPGLRDRQAEHLRLAKQHFVRTGDVDFELRFLHFDDGPRTDRGHASR